MKGKPVRKGRKEQKKGKRSDCERETRNKHKNANRKRKAEPATFGSLIGPVNSELLRCGFDPDFGAVFASELHRLKYADTPRGEYAERLHDPSVGCVHNLPFGLLDHRLDTIPDELIPQEGDFTIELRILLERMISRGREDGIVGTVLERWGWSNYHEKMDIHLTRLIEISQIDRKLYLALVSGRHWEIVGALAHDRIPRALSTEMIKEVLFRQSHLWCAHDVQLVVARNRFYEKFLVEGLSEHNKEVLRVNTYVGMLREAYAQLQQLSALQIAAGPEREERVKQFLEEFEKSKIGRLKGSLETSAAFSALAGSAEVPISLSEIEREIATRINNPTTKLMKILSGEIDPSSLSATFHEEHFGFTNLKATSLCVVRLLQFEVDGMDLIEAAIEAVKGGSEASIEPMGRFIEAESQLANKNAESPLRKRFSELFAAVRYVFLQDINKGKKEPGEHGNAYAEFERAIENIRDCEKDEKAAFCFDRERILMIDVLPDWRLSSPPMEKFD